MTPAIGLLLSRALTNNNSELASLMKPLEEMTIRKFTENPEFAKLLTDEGLMQTNLNKSFTVNERIQQIENRSHYNNAIKMFQELCSEDEVTYNTFTDEERNFLTEGMIGSHTHSEIENSDEMRKAAINVYCARHPGVDKSALTSIGNNLENGRLVAKLGAINADIKLTSDEFKDVFLLLSSSDREDLEKFLNTDDFEEASSIVEDLKQQCPLTNGTIFYLLNKNLKTGIENGSINDDMLSRIRSNVPEEMRKHIQILSSENSAQYTDGSLESNASVNATSSPQFSDAEVLSEPTKQSMKRLQELIFSDQVNGKEIGASWTSTPRAFWKSLPDEQKQDFNDWMATAGKKFTGKFLHDRGIDPTELSDIPNALQQVSSKEYLQGLFDAATSPSPEITQPSTKTDNSHTNRPWIK